MKFCDHIDWLDINDQNRWQLHYANRMTQTINQMISSSTQFSSSIFFIERKVKIIVLREIFSYNNIRKQRFEEFVNFRLDFFSLTSTFSLLLLNDDLTCAISRQSSSTTCHDYDILSLSWTKCFIKTVIDLIYVELVFLLSDVICVFADDLSDSTQIVKYLERWVKIESISSLFKETRSRFIIVMSHRYDSCLNDFMNLNDLNSQLNKENNDRCKEIFRFVFWVRMSLTRLSSMIYYRELKKTLLTKVDLTRQTRIETRVLFFVVHLRVFYSHAMRHLVHHVNEIFDFCQIARRDFEIKSKYRQHIFDFLEQDFDRYIRLNNLIDFLTFNILVDAYFSRMHSIFTQNRIDEAIVNQWQDLSQEVFFKSSTKIIAFEISCASSISQI